MVLSIYHQFITSLNFLIFAQYFQILLLFQFGHREVEGCWQCFPYPARG